MPPHINAKRFSWFYPIAARDSFFLEKFLRCVL